MDSQELRQIRHDLRTPVNHILGYTELALETAEDLRDCKWRARLQSILEHGRSILKEIECQLPRDGNADALLPGLQTAIAAPLAAIADLASAEVTEPYSEDMARVCAAVDRLARFNIGSNPDGNQSARPGVFVEGNGGDRILVVDDDGANRDVLVRMLKSEGYVPSTASDGDQALQMMTEHEFSLVLLDILMPRMTGLEVLEAMRASRKLNQVPVIVISALDDMNAVLQSIQAGAEDYLPKPFEPILLRARIGASISKSRLRRQLLAHERLASLGSLTAGVAHEIKNPLNFVTNFAEASAEIVDELDVKASVDESVRDLISDLRQNIGKICEHSRRADGIIRSMLQHARDGSSDRDCVDINKLVADSVRLAHQGSPDCAAVVVDIDLDSAPGTIEGSSADLARVFLNLTNNAIYAALEKRRDHDRPCVRVSTRRNGSFVEVRIRDNGAGVPASIRDKVFQPFFTTKPPGTGTGLGLSISYDVVVNGHSGQISLESKEGEYAEFIVRLPER